MTVYRCDYCGNEVATIRDLFNVGWHREGRNSNQPVDWAEVCGICVQSIERYVKMGQVRAA